MKCSELIHNELRLSKTDSRDLANRIIGVDALHDDQELSRFAVIPGSKTLRNPASKLGGDVAIEVDLAFEDSAALGGRAKILAVSGELDDKNCLGPVAAGRPKTIYVAHHPLANTEVGCREPDDFKADDTREPFGSELGQPNRK